MEHLDNNMDELFNKAGSKYPLKTDGANWEAVLKGLQQPGDIDLPEPPVKNNKKYRRFLWLLLLLPLSWICTNYINTGDNKTTADVNKKTVESKKGADVKTPVTNLPSTESTKPTAEKVTNSTAASATVTDANKKQAGGEGVNSDVAGNGANDKNGSSKVKGAIAKVNNNLVLANGANVNKPRNTVIKTSEKKTRKKHTAITGADTGSYQNTQAAIIPETFVPAGDKKENKADIKSTPTESVNENKEEIAAATSPVLDKAQDKDAAVKKETVVVKQDSAKTTDTTAVANKAVNKKSKVAPLKNKGFYAGILGGPDVSTVKFQSVKSVGYSLGLLIGYRFNKRIAVETGVQWDKKKYYTEGNYFDKSKTRIPSYVNIETLNGDCNMFEIPLNFRYDFVSRARSRFFGLAGLSTYIMKKENYAYMANANGNEWGGDWSYKNSLNNFFSIMNLSVGYEYKLGRIGSLRIEPYLKIPLTGLGIGSLPISSAGLNVGIIRSIP